MKGRKKERNERKKEINEIKKERKKERYERKKNIKETLVTNISSMLMKLFSSLPSACVEVKVILTSLDSVHILYHS